MNNVFIGYDPNETVAYHVLVNSIMRHASKPVSITPLILSQLPMHRPIEDTQSTQFSFTRYLVPWLCNYQGKAVFMDADMLVRFDINELFEKAEPFAEVTVVKHDYVPKDAIKFLGKVQTKYERKNWTSVMVFNNELCTALTPDAVNNMPSEWLRKLHWANNIGEMNKDFNHLVGEYEPNPNAKIVHYTIGTPCFAKYRDCEYAREWYDEKSLMLEYNRMGEFGKSPRIEP